MSIKYKLIAVIALTFAVLISTLYLTFSTELERNVSNLEDSDATATADRASRAIFEEAKSLGGPLIAWGKWDDFYTYLKDRNESFRKINFTYSAWIIPDIAFVFVLDSRRTLVDSLHFDRTKGEIVSPGPEAIAAIQAATALLQFRDPNGYTSGLVRIGGDTYMAVATTVTDTNGTVEPNGLLIGLVPVTNEAVKKIGADHGLTMKMVAADPAISVPEDAQTERSNDKLFVRLLLRDVSQRPAFWCEVERPRTAYIGGIKTRNSVLATTVVTGLISMLVVLLFVNQVVIKRVRILNRELRKIRSKESAQPRVTESGTDELGGLSRDINDVLQSLEMERQRAEDASTTKSRFLANMSHEIRTPMNGVIGMLELLSDDRLTKEQSELVDVARSSAIALVSLINDLLDISKIEADKMELYQEPFDFTALIEEAVRIVEPASKRKRLTFVMAVHGEVPRYVIGDSSKIRQVLLNLLGNAVKFTDNGAVLLQVSSQTKSDGSYEVWFAISDTGLGVSDQVQEQLFEPFFQGDVSVTTRYGGTGLGLSISSKLVNLMGGELLMQSKYKVGSCFFFSIQVKLATGVEIPKPAMNTVPEGVGGLRVLIAEDNPVNQLLAIKMLEKLGHRVTVVQNGKEAVDRFSEGAFDLVMLDIQMPIMDGEEAFRVLRSRPGGDVPVIALTANAMVGERDRYLAQGMDGYVSKPMNLGDLTGEIMRVVKNRKAASSTVESART